jgi:hypothetical protein
MYMVEIGSFCLDVPDHAKVECTMSEQNPHFPDLRVVTHWKILLERFQIFAHQESKHDLSELARHITWQTRQAEPKVIAVTRNGLDGVTHGDYNAPKTHIDWWFRGDGLTLCLTILSKTFPCTTPTQSERAENAAIIDSVRLARRD